MNIKEAITHVLDHWDNTFQPATPEEIVLKDKVISTLEEHIKEESIMELKMEHLEKCFTIAEGQGVAYVAVLIEMEGFEKPEIIIKQAKNIEAKFAYYKKTYDENLNHKHAPGIKIIGCTYGNTFSQIEHDLIG